MLLAYATGAATSLLARVSFASTNGIEQSLLDRLHPTKSSISQNAPQMTVTGTPTMNADPTMMMAAPRPQREVLPIEGYLPSLAGAVHWLNSPPLTAQSLKGHVVLINFWTYSYINCLRALPYVEAWAKKYRDQGLIVIGVHAPEFAFERNIDNVRSAIKRFGIDYPVAIDNNYAIWRAFHNEYRLAHYFIDADGHIRYHHFGEGNYDESERVIQELLREAGDNAVPSGIVSVTGSAIERAADMADVESPETYIGTDRASNFASPGSAVPDQTHNYTAPAMLALNQWAFAGTWQVGGEISYYFALNRVAEILDEDEEWLYELSIDMFAEDGCVTIYSKGENSITALSEFGIENLRETFSKNDLQVERHQKVHQKGQLRNCCTTTPQPTALTPNSSTPRSPIISSMCR